jgi:hypothetical protein
MGKKTFLWETWSVVAWQQLISKICNCDPLRCSTGCTCSLHKPNKNACKITLMSRESCILWHTIYGQSFNFIVSIIRAYSIFPFYSRLIPTVRWFVFLLLLQWPGISLKSWLCHLVCSYRTDTDCCYQKIIIWVVWHGLCKHSLILEIKLNTECRTTIS